MRIAIGNDHAGVGVKEKIQEHLEKKGHKVINKGYDGEESVDYPDFIHPVAKDSKGKKSRYRRDSLWKRKRSSNDSQQTQRGESCNMLE